MIIYVLQPLFYILLLLQEIFEVVKMSFCIRQYKSADKSKKIFMNLNEYRYISFDIFDTLLKRSVARPSDLFEYMEEYCHYNNIQIPDKFAQNRINAESTLRKRNGGEVTIDEIYTELQSYFNNSVYKLKSLELSLELNGCRANPEMVAILSKCIQSGKTVILISDMYLSSEFIMKMLEKCSIYGYAKIYVSCEHGCSKRNGDLYKKVLTDLNIKPNMLFHIGDNNKSDYSIPLSLGIHAHKIRSLQTKLCKVPKIIKGFDALIFKTITSCINNCIKGESEFGKLGAKTFGPILTGFSIWLKKQIEIDKINDIYFMSRDGYMLKRAFDALNIPNVKTHYLYCSRRAYTVPLLWKNISFENIFKTITFYGTITLSLFIMKLGMYPEDFIKEAAECGLDLNAKFNVDQFIQNYKVRNFYEKIKNKIIEQSKNEYETLLAYISSQHMDKKIGVVDIGYNGTMQNALELLIKEAKLGIEVKGYYVGVSPKSEIINKKMINASGYLYEKGKNEQIVTNVPSSIFELVFLNQHGSVKKFCYRNGQIEPEFYEYEYSAESDKIKKLIEYQNGAIHFINEYIGSFTHNALSISPEVALYNFKKMVFSPSKLEAEYWGDFEFFDVTYSVIAKPRNMLYYLFHFKSFLTDFKLSNWKIGFLYRLLNVPLPYSNIVSFAQRIYHFFNK